MTGGRITEWREEPTITERTLAAFVSGAKTRIFIDNTADNPSINGMYVPYTDTILLFRCKGKVPAVSVALEEAGHSQQRLEYLDTADRVKALRTRLEAWHPSASGLLDWYEDGRIYELLKAEYPGASHDLDHVFTLRRKHIESLAWDTRGVPMELRATARAQDVGKEYLSAVDRYQRGESFRTFTEVLKYLESLVSTKPVDYPPAPPGIVLLVTGDIATMMAGLRVQKAGELDIQQMTVLIELDSDKAAGLAGRAEYDWHVISNDSFDLEGR